MVSDMLSVVVNPLPMKGLIQRIKMQKSVFCVKGCWGANFKSYWSETHLSFFTIFCPIIFKFNLLRRTCIVYSTSTLIIFRGPKQIIKFTVHSNPQFRKKTLLMYLSNLYFRFLAVKGSPTHKVVLPDDISCKFCILQWTYTTGKASRKQSLIIYRQWIVESLQAQT